MRSKPPSMMEPRLFNDTRSDVPSPCTRLYHRLAGITSASSICRSASSTKRSSGCCRSQSSTRGLTTTPSAASRMSCGEVFSNRKLPTRNGGVAHRCNQMVGFNSRGRLASVTSGATFTKTRAETSRAFQESSYLANEQDPGVGFFFQKPHRRDCRAGSRRPATARLHHAFDGDTEGSDHHFFPPRL